MDFLNAIRELINQNRYEEALEALSGLPEQAVSPQSTYLYALALLGKARAGNPARERPALLEAFELLEELEEEEDFETDSQYYAACAMCLYYLEQHRKAQDYFELTLESAGVENREVDSDIQEAKVICENALREPHFVEPFAKRVENAWNAFLKCEGQLRTFVDVGTDALSERISDTVGRCLKEALSDAVFEVGYKESAGRYELVLSADGWKERLFKLEYFVRHAPPSLLEKWIFSIGLQPFDKDWALKTSGSDGMSQSEVQVWVSVDEDKDFSLKLYSDALVPMLHDRNQVDRAWWLAGMLTQHAIGELNMMSYCNGFELLDKPARGESITLKELSAYLEKAGVPLSLDPNEHLKQYLTFQKDPDPVEDAGLFNDVLTGSLATAFYPLLRDYITGEQDGQCYEAEMADGVCPGFFAYPIEDLHNAEAVFAVRNQVENFVSSLGENTGRLIGGATGVHAGYVLFLAWDINTVLEKARTFFENLDRPFSLFAALCPGAEPLFFKEDDSEEESSTGFLRTAGCA